MYGAEVEKERIQCKDFYYFLATLLSLTAESIISFERRPGLLNVTSLFQRHS